jgi:signal transduction histidine kinase
MSARAWTITLIVISAVFAMSAAGNISSDELGAPPPLKAYAMLGCLAMLAACALLWWRHRSPVKVSAILTIVTLAIPTSALPPLIALAALTYARKGMVRWGLIVATYAATIVAYCWDLAGADSLIAIIINPSAAGTPARLALYWAVPLLAALSVAPFAAYGIVRRMRLERDGARHEGAEALQAVSALQHEVDQQNQRQEIARELHDTLAADLSQVALHAGALELMASGAGGGAADAARIVRESTQRSMDDLRHLVQSLRDRNPVEVGIGSTTGLGDLPDLIDGALRDGLDVRTQLMVNDAGSCSPRVGHAAYRAVQESLSNVRRHASGVPVTVGVRGAPDAGLTVRVTNPVASAVVPTTRGGGHGLQGMRERAELVGGTFEAGPAGDGTFVVRVWMPWDGIPRGLE